MLSFCSACACCNWMVSWKCVFGDTVTLESVSVLEGDSVALNSGFTEMMDDDLILWRFGAENTLIAQISVMDGSMTVFDDVLDERFRDRLKLNNQTGSLIITNTRTEHTGLYQLQTNSVSKSFSLTVYAHLPVPVISSNSTNCSSSSSSSSYCSLLCSVVNVGHVTLSWFKGHSLLSSISVSDLSISLSLPLEVEYQDNNTYSCVLNNPISNQTRHINISQLCQTCSGTAALMCIFTMYSASKTVPISAAAAGSLLIVAAVGIFCICRKCRKTDEEVETNEDEITYIEPMFYKRKPQKPDVKEDDHVEYAPIAKRR
ncbi:natural killer cell receptor 2B4-like isoform X2 [Onychostoma macrolepis]|uniref:natural killer cell receptor 2B4-like isoform X2 n=1 Tax=Onychostoma macrolepis TaxID=369639 RepID=UPI00272D367A|nr:natural killer cell receptor 2B4-like isoform X2 [Onychostoma macrolepis]